MKPATCITNLLLLLLLLPSPFLVAKEEPKQQVTIELPDTSKPAPTQPEAPAAKPAPPAVKAKSAILVDAVSGQILWERNAHVRRPMASTTKIMTAILVMENCGMDTEVVASKHACETTNSSIHLKPGEQLTVRNVLYGMLIRSANDACVAAGERVAGNLPAFIKMMNARAKEIGAADTNFVNPHGLHDPAHYSSAYDLVLMTRHAVCYPVFNDIVKMRKVSLERSKNKEDVVLFNHSKFLKHYPGADGIKSGYTKQAGRCYVGSATRGGWRLISVVLDAPNVEADTTALMNYGFDNFQPTVLAAGNQMIQLAVVKGGRHKYVPAVASASLLAVASKWRKQKVSMDVKLNKVTAPVRRGQRIGEAVALVDGKPVQTVPLLAAEDVGKSVVVTVFPWARDGFILLLGLVVSVKYGAAAAKSLSGGRSRIAQEVRRPDRRG